MEVQNQRSILSRSELTHQLHLCQRTRSTTCRSERNQPASPLDERHPRRHRLHRRHRHGGRHRLCGVGRGETPSEYDSGQRQPVSAVPMTRHARVDMTHGRADNTEQICVHRKHTHGRAHTNKSHKHPHGGERETTDLWSGADSSNCSDSQQAPHCTVSRRTTPYCVVPRRTAPQHTAPYRTAAHRAVPPYTAPHQSSTAGRETEQATETIVPPMPPRRRRR